MKELNKLVELAKKATPGKWWIDSHGHTMVAFNDDDMEIVFVTKSEAMGSAKRHEDTGNLSHWRNDNDATFIAAANPATILAIAEAFRALEKRAEAAEAKLAELGSSIHQFGRKQGVAAMQSEELVMAALSDRPAPAVSLAELVPPEADGSNLPFAANGWNACRAAMLKGDGDEQG